MPVLPAGSAAPRPPPPPQTQKLPEVSPPGFVPGTDPVGPGAPTNDCGFLNVDGTCLPSPPPHPEL